MKKIIVLIFICLASVLLAPAREFKVADVPNVQLADSNAYVADPENMLAPATVEALNSMARNIRRTSSAEPYIAVIGSTGSVDIDNFATDLFGRLGLGKSDKDNGLLIVVARDDRRAAIRTGYGLEGVLPDVICGRILRNEAFPEFREGNYDAGILSAMTIVENILTDPENVPEIYSSERDNRSGSEDDDSMDVFMVWVYVWAMVSFVMLLVVVSIALSVRKKDRLEKYNTLERLRTPYLAATFLGLGLPLIASLPLVIMLRHWRDGKRKCPNCGTQMVKIDEVHDNEYLTPSQDAEERIQSVDYDVWKCPTCNYMEIIPYVNKSAPFEVCDRCGARTARLTGNHVVKQPTVNKEGIGQRTYKCMHCGHDQNRTYKIAKLAPVVVVPVGGRGGGSGFGGGGGFSGGGFGGGFTGGGGASGGW